MTERLIYEDTGRLEFLIYTPIDSGGLLFWDPQCDIPLPDNLEKIMSDMGPRAYLEWLKAQHNIECNEPSSDHEAARAARKAIRVLAGDRFLQ